MSTHTSVAALEINEVSIARAAKLLRVYIAKKKSTMLWGPPGVGKSAIIHQIAKALGWKVIDFRANIREPVDVRGIPVPDLKTGTTRWLCPDELPQVERDGEFGVLFLDEINTASPQMMAVLFQLVLERRVGDYVLPDGWVIVAAGNRVTDRAAAQRMPTALRNRFAHIYVTVDVDAWCNWATGAGVAPELVAFQRYRGKDVMHIMPRGDENAFPTPRSWTDSAQYINEPRDIRLDLMAGCVGRDRAAEFDGFIDLYRSLGDLDDIIANPETATVPGPGEASVRYMICTALGRKADRKNFPAIYKYAQRLPRESQALVMHDATLREPKLKETKTYGDWAVNNQDIVLQMS